MNKKSLTDLFAISRFESSRKNHILHVLVLVCICVFILLICECHTIHTIDAYNGLGTEKHFQMSLGYYTFDISMMTNNMPGLSNSASIIVYLLYKHSRRSSILYGIKNCAQLINGTWIWFTALETYFRKKSDIQIKFLNYTKTNFWKENGKK